MENKIDCFIEMAYSSLNNVFLFAKFVSDSEFFAVQNPQIFKNLSLVDEYTTLWGELEIVNALALCQWEEDGRAKEWGKHWTENYKEQATEAVHELINFMKKIC
ncbi:hypothetical protein B7C51_02635 [Paenibacillus larvae subsp. pulvifaciens]|uniref:Uncharacterized protein n=1 Tax=Paenibacillus larvae subsp. pulvifaciens TaxID=1477 RepID=A0A1V0UP79_9BACL|nr:hypothetical protein [Paenibacillus larvae]ARF66937.1 hypothetical protein B7C51_02635 [Paenibacillus larvae subsp. pulvifaciens]